MRPLAQSQGCDCLSCSAHRCELSSLRRTPFTTVASLPFPLFRSVTHCLRRTARCHTYAIGKCAFELGARGSACAAMATRNNGSGDPNTLTDNPIAHG